MEFWLFYLFAAAALAAAINVLVQRRVFYSALSLIVCLTFLAGIYMLLRSPFIAAVQVIVYAGAIMVLFLFVIMLLDPYSGALLQDRRKSLTYVAALLGATCLILLCSLLSRHDPGIVPQFTSGQTANQGTVEAIGDLLFQEYLLPFEVTSILILVAIMGTVILAKRKV